MAENDDLFKTTAFGGYDKEEVQIEIQKIKENARAERSQILLDLEECRRSLESARKELSNKDTQIAELRETLANKDRELLEQERMIKDKYQSYVDNYDTIGSLVYEAKLRAKQINRETDDEREKILEQANADAERIRAEAESAAREQLKAIQEEIDQRNMNGKVQYEAVQEELNSVLETFRQVQKQVMNSYRTIQTIASGRTAYELREMESDEEDF